MFTLPYVKVISSMANWVPCMVFTWYLDVHRPKTPVPHLSAAAPPCRKPHRTGRRARANHSTKPWEESEQFKTHGVMSKTDSTMTIICKLPHIDIFVPHIQIVPCGLPNGAAGIFPNLGHPRKPFLNPSFTSPNLRRT